MSAAERKAAQEKAKPLRKVSKPKVIYPDRVANAQSREKK